MTAPCSAAQLEEQSHSTRRSRAGTPQRGIPDIALSHQQKLRRSPVIWAHLESVSPNGSERGLLSPESPTGPNFGSHIIFSRAVMHHGN
jgi:hypothetical protein